MAWVGEVTGILIEKAGLVGALLATFIVVGYIAAHFKLIPKFPVWAAFVLMLLFFAFMFVALNKDIAERWLFRTQTVDVILRTEDGALVDCSFELKVQIRDHGVKTLEGREGVAEVRGIPSAERTLNIISVVASGWRIRDPSKDFPISDGVVKVVMAKAGPVPPADDTRRPDPNVSAPSEQQLNEKTAVNAEDVTFHYSNRTRDKLVLVLYPYNKSKTANEWSVKPKWLDFPLTDQWQFYDKFKEGGGWMGVWVRDQNEKYWPLGTHNLFTGEEVWMTVDKGDADKPYKVKFSSDQPTTK